jgi:Protein of unknown function (DUF1761)
LRIGAQHLTGAALLVLGAWIAFLLMVTTSWVVWENISWQLAAIHGGDWLLKLLIIAVIVVLRHEHAARRTATPSSAILITRFALSSKSCKYSISFQTVERGEFANRGVTYWQAVDGIEGRICEHRI